MVSENKKSDVAQNSAKPLSREEEADADKLMKTQERRNNGRMRQFKGGRIIFNNGNGSFDCLIRNISKEGVKIQLEGHSAIPKVVELQVPGDGISYACQVIWRTSREMGMRFLSDAKQIGEKHDLKDIFTE